MTRKEAVKELRRLLKPRTYLIKFWKNQHIEIEVAWKSDTSVSVEGVDYITVPRNRKRGIFTDKQVQKDIIQFEKDVKLLCDISDKLAKQEGTDSETYFEDLMFEEEK